MSKGAQLRQQSRTTIANCEDRFESFLYHKKNRDPAVSILFCKLLSLLFFLEHDAPLFMNGLFIQ